MPLACRRYLAAILPALIAATLASCAEPRPIAPRGLRPRLTPRPFGGPEVAGNELTLGLAVDCAGRPVPGVQVAVCRSRSRRDRLWLGTTDAQGHARPKIPKDTQPPRLAVALSKHGYSTPAHVRLTWDLERKTISATWDNTLWVSTASLGKWELSEGGAHVCFAWPHRAVARQVLAVLLAQRRAVADLLGVEPEPMGAIIVAGPDDAKRYIAQQGGRTQRTGQFVHGVRSWPIQATSTKELLDRPAEKRELFITLAHELAENTLLNVNLVAITHQGTRWFRDGLAEAVATRAVPAEHAGLVAFHIGTRIDDLRNALRAGEAAVDLLAWRQNSTAPNLPRYAAAMAIVEEILAKIGTRRLRGIVVAASQRPATNSADLQAMLAEAGAADTVRRLTAVDLRRCIPVLEARKKSFEKKGK